jgi:hypothetical protein
MSVTNLLFNLPAFKWSSGRVTSTRVARRKQERKEAKARKREKVA